MGEESVTVYRIENLDDLKKLPFKKDNLVQAGNFFYNIKPLNPQKKSDSL